jgi:Recombination endonuclease VII
MRLDRAVLAEIIETHVICEICDEPAKVVDHDHERKLYRGRLCNACNRGIGFLKDSAETVTRAAVYLQDYEDRVTGSD